MKNNNHIYVLDCTLRDGGYVNNWEFGDANAKQIVESVIASGVDYVELGFVRNCEYISNRLEFSEMSQVSKIFRPSGYKLALMVEIGYGYSVDNFPIRSSNTVDLIRLVVWKRMQAECYAYAQTLLEKGYEVAIQATRTEQYTSEEFAEFVNRFSQLGVTAIYMVDTFGLLTKDDLLLYARVADDNMRDGIRLGYHAHNNMQQAFSNMVAIAEQEWNHDLMIDASIMGMGRGAGNLCLELLEKYMNEKFEGHYNESIIYEAADKYIQPIYRQHPWGYSIPYLLSAKYGRNPSYVPCLVERGLSIPQMEIIFGRMKQDGIGIRYDVAECNKLIDELLKK